MKTLYLLRHAKAAVDSPTGSDHDRALDTRGNEDAPRVADAMKSRAYVPDLILCSSARRAQETCRHVHAILGDHIPTQTEQKLYLAPDEVILSIVRNANSSAASILVIGHNPGMEELGCELGSQGAPPKFPTAAMAVFEFDVETWIEIDRGMGRIIDFLSPKTL